MILFLILLVIVLTIPFILNNRKFTLFSQASMSMRSINAGANTLSDESIVTPVPVDRSPGIETSANSGEELVSASAGGSSIIPGCVTGAFPTYICKENGTITDNDVYDYSNWSIVPYQNYVIVDGELQLEAKYYRSRSLPALEQEVISLEEFEAMWAEMSCKVFCQVASSSQTGGTHQSDEYVRPINRCPEIVYDAHGRRGERYGGEIFDPVTGDRVEVWEEDQRRPETIIDRTGSSYPDSSGAGSSGGGSTGGSSGGSTGGSSGGSSGGNNF